MHVQATCMPVGRHAGMLAAHGKGCESAGRQICMQLRREPSVIPDHQRSAPDLAVATLSSAGVLEERGVTSPLPLSSIGVAGAAGFVALSTDGTSVCALSSGRTALSCALLSTLAPRLPAGRGLRLVATPSGAIVYSPSPEAPGAALLSLWAGQLSLLKFDSGASAVSAPVKLPNTGGHAVALVAVPPLAGGATTVSVVSLESGEELYNDAIEAALPDARVQTLPSLSSAYLGTFPRKASGDGGVGVGFRVLVVHADGRVALLQQSQKVWERAEALGAILASRFAELPAPGVSESGGGASALSGCERDWAAWLRLQVLTTKVSLQLSTAEDAAQLQVKEQQEGREGSVVAGAMERWQSVIVAGPAGCNSERRKRRRWVDVGRHTYLIHQGDG
eukprot:365157-Chlamydomonas_euryale.AAC.21